LSIPAHATTERAIAGFFADGVAAFERAAASAGPIEDRRSVASGAVRIRLAGPALASYAMPALAHHPVPDRGEGSGLTVAAFDTRSTGSAMPAPVWPTTAYTPTSEISGLEGDRFTVAFNVGTGVLDVLDNESGSALHWIEDARRHPAYDASSPFRLLFHWWLRRRGIHFLHAGAVARGGKGLLLAGRGGSGKSTVALACLLAGFDFLGDDYVAASPSPPRAFNLYGSAKLEGGHLAARLPRLTGAVVGHTEAAGRGKAILAIPGELVARIRERAEIVALVLPRVMQAARSSLRPAGPAEALRALVPSTCLQLTALRRSDIDAMAALARALPAFTLEVGRDLEAVPDLLAGLLDRSGA
jgi:hypothetical protein